MTDLRRSSKSIEWLFEKKKEPNDLSKQREKKNPVDVIFKKKFCGYLKKFIDFFLII